jgi:hypothetical protein
VRSMPPRVLARRLFGDLGRIMLPAFFHGHPGRRPTRPLGFLEFVTVPRAASVEGMCETQWVTVYFEPAGAQRGADTPVRPRAITSSPGYIIRDLARVRANPAGDAENESNADAACRAIDSRNEHSISGHDAFEVQAGLRALLALIDAAREGRSLAPLDCSDAVMDGAPMGDAACLAAIGRLGVGDIALIGSCASDAAGPRCHRIAAGEFEMRLVMEPNGRQLAHAKLETMIIIADERID